MANKKDNHKTATATKHRPLPYANAATRLAALTAVSAGLIAQPTAALADDASAPVGIDTPVSVESTITAASATEIEAAKTTVDAAKVDVDSAKSDMDAAQSKLDGATEDKSQADAAASSAESDAKSELDSETANAESNVSKAQSGIDSAENDRSQAESDIESAKGDVEAAKAELEDAKNEQSSATDAANAAKGNLDATGTSGYDAAKDTENEAQASYDSAKDAQASAAADKAEADKHLEQATKDEADAASKLEAALKANENRDATQSKVDAAKKALEAAQSKVDEAKANEDLLNKQGMIGLFEIMSKDASLTEDQRNEATIAMEMLKGTSDRGTKPEWFDELVASPEVETSPLSRTSLERILDYLDPTNTLRADNNVPDLKVGLTLMAKAAINTCYSYYTFDHAASDYGLCSSENIAGINWSANYEGGLHEDDVWWPYSGWYTDEKAIVEANPDTYTWEETGHYWNLISDMNVSFGMAMGRGTKMGEGAWGGSVITWDASWREGDFTIEEFKTLVRGYLHGYSDAMSALEAAQEAYDAALAELVALPDSEAAKTAYDEAKAALDAAQADVEAKAQTLSEANATLTSAKATLAAAKQASADAYAPIKALVDAYDASKETKAAADARVASAETALASAESKLASAEDAFAAATDAVASAKADKDYWSAILDALNAVDIDGALANGTTGDERLSGLNVKLATAKDAKEAAAAFAEALVRAEAELADKTETYQAAKASYDTAAKAYEAARFAYGSQQEPIRSASPSADADDGDATQAVALRPRTAHSTDANLPTTGDATLLGEAFVIGGLTFVAAGVFLTHRRKDDEGRS